MLMVAKGTKLLMCMFRMEGLTAEEISWKYMDQIFEIQFKEI